MENISVFFLITLLSYILQNLAMKTLAILLAVAAILSVSVTAAGLNNSDIPLNMPQYTSVIL
jgi:hypothetical protein